MASMRTATEKRPEHILVVEGESATRNVLSGFSRRPRLPCPRRRRRRGAAALREQPPGRGHPQRRRPHRPRCPVDVPRDRSPRADRRDRRPAAVPHPRGRGGGGAGGGGGGRRGGGARPRGGGAAWGGWGGRGGGGGGGRGGADPRTVWGDRTGKELVARACSTADAPARPAVREGQLRGAAGDLLESELFGTSAGAFTGAHQRQARQVRGGRRRHDLPRRDRRDAARCRPSCCACSRTASSRASAASRHRVDVRVVAATNRDLERAIRRAASARTSTTASTSSRSRCRRCASGARTSRCSSSTSCSAAGRGRRAPAVTALSAVDAGAVRELRLAGQRARAREHRQADRRARRRAARRTR